MDKFKIIIFLLGILPLINCQKMKNEKPIPSYNVQISHPGNNYLITPVEDNIITLEGMPAHLPYGSSSGSWGNSGKGFTEQQGTPIGVNIVYFSRYEDAFYHLKVDFPKDKVKDLIQRAYANAESKSSTKPLKEYIDTTQESDYDKTYNGLGKSYDKFSDLIFGFAPNGMVVVWLGFGPTQIELGKYTAERIKDDKIYADKLFSKISQTREGIKKDMFIEGASLKQWEDYRILYKWSPKISSGNKGFRLFNVNVDYYNAERETMLRPWVENIPVKDRAIPKEITFFWETVKGESFEGRAFFDWQKTNEAFKKAGNNLKLEFKIAPDNNNYEILLNGEPFKADSLRVYNSNFTFKESYK